MLDWNDDSFLDILNYFNRFPNFPSLPIKADKIGYKGNSIKALGRLSPDITLRALSWSTSLPCFCSVYRCFIVVLMVFHFVRPQYSDLHSYHIELEILSVLSHPYAAWTLMFVRIDAELLWLPGLCFSCDEECTLGIKYSHWDWPILCAVNWTHCNFTWIHGNSGAR